MFARVRLFVALRAPQAFAVCTFGAAARYGLAQLNRSLFTLAASPMHALNKVQQLRWDAHGRESSGQ